MYVLIHTAYVEHIAPFLYLRLYNINSDLNPKTKRVNYDIV
jgi:hypothetical protein